MKPSHDLFRLIKSMTKTEKRSFKLFASKHIIGEENNYVRLFDAIDKQEAYDEERIKKKFEGETFVRNLPSEKHYLYHLILDSLHVYHLNLSYESVLKKQLHQVSILFQKGLYEQCGKVLDKIKDTALKLEKYPYVYEAIYWEKRLIKMKSYTGIGEEGLQEIFSQGKQTLEQVQNIDEYLYLQEKLILLFNKYGEVRSEEQKQKYDLVMKHPLLSDENRATNHISKRLFNNIHTVYNFSANNTPVNADKYVRRCLELVEEVPEHIKEDPNIYIVVLTNFLSTCSQFKNHQELKPAIEKMRNISKNFNVRLPVNLEMKIFVNSWLFELDMYILSGEFEKIKEVIPSIEEGLELHRNGINKANERTLYYNIAYLFFGANEYKRSIEWMNKLLNAEDIDAKQDIICFCKILQLIVHYEMENIDLLPYILKSTYRFLRKRNSIYKAETIVLNILKKLPDANNRALLHAIFNEAAEEFQKIADDPFEKNAFRYFDFITWFRSKTSGRSFAEIVREKA